MGVTTEAWGYLPIIILIVIAVGLASTLLLLNRLLGGRKPMASQLKEKVDVYECGVPATGDARQQFSVRYYLVGIVFLLFDVEVVFMYPWAVVYRKFLSVGPFILIEMLFFMVLLMAGYAYLLRRHALSWD